MQNVTVRDIVTATSGTLLCGDENTVIENISIDSRAIKGNDIFIPFSGEKTDGHRFVEAAFKNGAAAAFSTKKDIQTSDKPIILVDNAMTALQSLGAWYRKSRVKIPVIGITGSVGKTSTREIIAKALSAKYNVFSTKGNYNGQIGVPMTLCDISKDDEIAVIEMGVSLNGEMSAISAVACVNLAVVTNIGICHIENFATQENICAEKLKIIDNMPDGGTLILNGDDPLLTNFKTDRNINIVYYGTSKHCQYRAENITVTSDGTDFDLIVGDIRRRVRLKVAGKHNVMNTLAAIAVCDTVGVDINSAVLQLQTYGGFSRRMEKIDCKTYTIIDDAYNASPDSVRAAIDILSDMTVAGKKYIVLADMLELGKDEVLFHRQIGEYLADKAIDCALFIGKLSKATAEAARIGQHMTVHEFDDNESAYSYLKAKLGSGDTVLFKGSHSMRLEQIIDKLRQSEE